MVSFGACRDRGHLSYNHERNPTAASSVVARIEPLTSILSDFPLAGHITDETEVRVLSVTLSGSSMLSTPRQMR
jgi:hypothetical protein